MQIFNGRPVKSISPVGHGSNSYYVVYADNGKTGVVHANALAEGLRSDEPMSIGEMGKNSMEASRPKDGPPKSRAIQWDDRSDAPANENDLEQIMSEIKNQRMSGDISTWNNKMMNAYNSDEKYREYVNDMNALDREDLPEDQDIERFDILKSKHRDYISGDDYVSPYPQLDLPKKKEE